VRQLEVRAFDRVQAAMTAAVAASERMSEDAMQSDAAFIE